MAVQEVGVVQVFGVQRVGQAEHERHVGIRANRPPVGFEEVGDIVTHRADTHNIDSGRAPRFELTLGGVIGDAALIDLHVLHADTTETHDKFGVFGHVFGCRRLCL